MSGARKVETIDCNGADAHGPDRSSCNRYDAQAGDNFNDLKRSPTAPGRLHGFTSSAGLERSGSLIAFSIDDLALLARGRLLGLFWFCGR
jgi:hypothetical protein